MAFISWRKDYEVGVALIDTEHRRLFELINEFHDAYLHGDGRKEIPRMLNQLVAYAEEHFQHEENLMRENEYPKLDKHSELHGDLVSAVFAINERLAADPARASAETLQFVKKWLQDHILHDDMEIADFLRGKANRASHASRDDAAADGEPAAGAAAPPAAGSA